jgi:hypothetical protein
VPKIYKTKKPPKKLKPGEKTKEWEDAREDLKKIFAEFGITSCELNLKGCRKDNFLMFTHLAKRHKLTQEDFHVVVLCCMNCHSTVEYLGKCDNSMPLVHFGGKPPASSTEEELKRENFPAC